MRKLPFGPVPNFSAEDIRIIREETGLTYDEFALAIGANPQSVRAWEKGGLKTGAARRVIALIWENPDKWKATYTDDPEPIAIQYRDQARENIPPNTMLGAMLLEDAISMYEGGATLRQVAAIARLSRERVRQVLTGVGVRRSSFAAGMISNQKRTISKDELVAAIDDGCTSVLKLQYRLRRARATVYRALVECGISLLPSYDPVKAAFLAEVSRRYDAGEKIAAIALAVHSSIHTVHRVLVNAGKHKPVKARPRVRRYTKLPEHIVAEVVRLKRDEGLTEPEIGRRLKLGQPHVHTILGEYGLAKRRPGYISRPAASPTGTSAPGP